MHKFLISAVIAGAATLAPIAGLGGLASAAGNGAGGVTGPAFYVDGELYRTVGTPTDLSGTGAPAHAYDTIYAIDGQRNVAEAKPGDRDFNGGRWQVRPVAFDDYGSALAEFDANGSGDFDADAEILAAVEAGVASIGDPVRSFVCPVIALPAR